MRPYVVAVMQLMFVSYMSEQRHKEHNGASVVIE